MFIVFKKVKDGREVGWVWNGGSGGDCGKLDCVCFN